MMFEMNTRKFWAPCNKFFNRAVQLFTIAVLKTSKVNSTQLPMDYCPTYNNFTDQRKCYA